MSSTTIAAQANEFTTGFDGQIGPELAGVFAREQADLVAGGAPADAVAVGDTVPDAALTTQIGRAHV